ncbi:MAG: hypothetical protein L6R37_003194 [Teloschistes peruensis]|nr:MAG: hypothetical protein L6R37_003194 [Teloschistes peruensis]
MAVQSTQFITSDMITRKNRSKKITEGFPEVRSGKLQYHKRNGSRILHSSDSPLTLEGSRTFHSLDSPLSLERSCSLTPSSNTLIDLTADTYDNSESSSVTDMDIDPPEQQTTSSTPSPPSKEALSPADPPSILDTTKTDDLSDSDLSSAMDMDSTEDEMEMPKATGAIKQGFICLTRGHHVGIRFGRPRLWVPPKELVGGGEETEVETEKEEVRPSIEEAKDWSLVNPRRVNLPSNPITLTDSTDNGEETEVEEEEWLENKNTEEEEVRPSIDGPKDWSFVTPKRVYLPPRARAMPSNPNMATNSTYDSEETEIEVEVGNEETEEEEVLPSIEDPKDWSFVTPKRVNPPPRVGTIPSNPITLTDSTDDEEEPPKTKKLPKKKYFPTHHRRNAISGPSTPRAPQPPTFPPPPPVAATDGISALLHAAALIHRASTTTCTSPHCPITTPHGEGLYRHPFPVPRSERANGYFAPSTPPPDVVAAFNHAVLGGGFGGFGGNGVSGGSGRVGGVVAGFFACHTEACRSLETLQNGGAGGREGRGGGRSGRGGRGRGPKWGVFTGTWSFGIRR